MHTLDLSKATLLGSGNERMCYLHPEKDECCIKVNRPGVVHRSQNKIELYYFNKLASRNIPFTHLPKFYGTVETEQGTGLVFERIRNSDMSPSQRLDVAIEEELISKEESYTIVNDLFEYCYLHGICIGDINADQILLKNNDGKLTPIIIDGLGTRRYGLKLFLIANFKFIARRKLKKSWPTLLRKLNL